MCVTNCPRCSTHNCGQQCWTTVCYYFRRLYTVQYVYMYVFVRTCVYVSSHRRYMYPGMHIYNVDNCGMSSQTANTAILLWLKETCSYIVVYVCFLLVWAYPSPSKVCVCVYGLYVSPPTGDRMWSGVFDITVLNHKHETSGRLLCSPASRVYTGQGHCQTTRNSSVYRHCYMCGEGDRLRVGCVWDGCKGCMRFCGDDFRCGWLGCRRYVSQHAYP